MPKLRVHGFAISLDGYGAGPDQSLDNPLGVGGVALHEWVFATRTFRQMFGQEGGATGVDDDFAARGFANIGAWILGRNMFGPVRGPWPDDTWKGWWGDNPPYHCPVFVLTNHPRASIRWTAAPPSTSSPMASTPRWGAPRRPPRPRHPARRRSRHDPAVSARGSGRRDAPGHFADAARLGRAPSRRHRRAEARLPVYRARSDGERHARRPSKRHRRGWMRHAMEAEEFACLSSSTTIRWRRSAGRR